jgi:hypothetical protein
LSSRALKREGYAFAFDAARYEANSLCPREQKRTMPSTSRVGATT